MRLSLVAVALASLSIGCWVPIEQGQAFEADLVRLKSTVEEQRKAREQDESRAQRERDRLREEQEAAVRKVDAKVKELGEAQEALNRTALKTGANLALDLDKTAGDVARLRGQIEELQVQQQRAMQQLADELAKARVELTAANARIAVLEDERKDAERKEYERKKAERPNNKDDFYKLAKEKLDDGDIAAARQLFTEFIAKWKDDPLAANSQYWLGETYYAERKWREAVFEFRKVADGYPKSDKAADSLLKIAYAFAELGLNDDARLFLDEVQHSYPKSNAAKLAKDKAAELKKK